MRGPVGEWRSQRDGACRERRVEASAVRLRRWLLQSCALDVDRAGRRRHAVRGETGRRVVDPANDHQRRGARPQVGDARWRREGRDVNYAEPQSRDVPPVLLTIRRRMSSVPKVELLAGSDVKSRTRFGGLAAPPSSRATRAAERGVPLDGRGKVLWSRCPSRWPAPARRSVRVHEVEVRRVVVRVHWKTSRGARAEASVMEPPCRSCRARTSSQSMNGVSAG